MSLISLTNNIFNATAILDIIDEKFPGFKWRDGIASDDRHVVHIASGVELVENTAYRYGGISHEIRFGTQNLPAQIYDTHEALTAAIHKLFAPLLERAARGYLPAVGEPDEPYDTSGDEVVIDGIIAAAGRAVAPALPKG